MKDNILEVQDLSYVYADGTKALHQINLEIRNGKTTAVLGGNGAGKSTLFLNLNGILKPSSGRILFGGKPLEYSHGGLRELRRRVGIVFQDPDTQLFSASVYQDISFGPVNMKLPEQEVRRRVEGALARTGISHLKDKATHCLSFGQKKRVAIAGILAMEPEVLVLDEPTAGLDPMGSSEIMKLMMETQKELGISVVIATHDIDIVPLYCDRAYVLNEGKVIMGGTPTEVFSRKELVRSVHLRLPRIGHLMEILQEKDGWGIANAFTISEARRAFQNWKDSR
ncbi:cobalt ABC transporter, ATPase subunit [Syntrophobotulus glycolicus DSM 8271]|uniref:ABC transporter ATP-binding protein n=1 Tax=Syntrophobotulus glycolicus (strain DSM 8271 / FlGlyR) TaxID=645991 RepID=F0SZ46_SYNGF|nr:ATP-binding cassette domain-containing protein [Syntrophobotulus glycolicus]ADY57164.1 cobalt ABC transporter, ATPase subunit [Syntrophobotulus glycolicus DSM 8271]